MPFFAMAIGWITSNAKTLVKYALFASFVAAMVGFAAWVLSFATSIYNTILNAANDVLSASVPDFAAGLMGALGLDTFVSSAFSILFSAIVVWVTGVGTILGYKFAVRTYHNFFRVLS